MPDSPPATAVDREVEWLVQHIDGDGLPALLKTDGGPWDVIQAYQPRSAERQKTSLYVLRDHLSDVRFAQQRRITSHTFHVKARWPVGATTTGTEIWEDEQWAFDQAVDLLLARVRGYPLDHTHGGRFLSVAEAPDPGRIDVRFTDPEQTSAGAQTALLASITYSADDHDFTA